LGWNKQTLFTPQYSWGLICKNLPWMLLTKLKCFLASSAEAAWPLSLSCINIRLRWNGSLKTDAASYILVEVYLVMSCSLLSGSNFSSARSQTSLGFSLSLYLVTKKWCFLKLFYWGEFWFSVNLCKTLLFLLPQRTMFSIVHEINLQIINSSVEVETKLCLPRCIFCAFVEWCWDSWNMSKVKGRTWGGCFRFLFHRATVNRSKSFFYGGDLFLLSFLTNFLVIKVSGKINLRCYSEGQEKQSW